ncbi:TPA: DUF550 domain-containing protein [Escherichia coli]|nr:DUF550 domain-containing protein [Escherichia coli]
MTTITKERIELFIKNPLENGLTRGEQMELARIALASLEREQIRHEHAKWSDSTFGCVGPIGPLKHLSKEALEAAAEPDDLSEWADMQFLLWDAQRQSLIDAAMASISLIQLKLRAGRKLTQAETTRLNAVLDYIDAVTATDTSTAPDVIWPELPEE